MEKILAYKGFDVNLCCRGFQYEIGKEYELPEGVNPSLCNAGFHACENPADVFAYYAPSESRYCIVELSGQIVRGDDKSCASRIKIVRELTLQELSEERRKYVEAHLDGEAKASNTGYRSSASNTGYRSSASNTGYQSSASNTGYQSSASNTGDRSSASNTGYQSSASNTGNRSSASNTGNQSSASNTGYQSSASNTGYQSSASNTGNRSSASNTGNRSSAEVSGKDSVAAVFGRDSKVRGAKGCALFLTERGEWNGETHPILNVLAVIVDGDKVKEGTWYKLVGGELTEVNE